LCHSTLFFAPGIIVEVPLARLVIFGVGRVVAAVEGPGVV